MSLDFLSSAKPEVKHNIHVGWCAKCRSKTEMKDCVKKTLETKKGVKAIIVGNCTICNTKMGLICALNTEV
jgi:hypothetical protein